MVGVVGSWALGRNCRKTNAYAGRSLRATEHSGLKGLLTCVGVASCAELPGLLTDAQDTYEQTMGRFQCESGPDTLLLGSASGVPGR